MFRSTLSLLAILSAAPLAAGLHLLDGNIRAKQTLRMHYAAAKAVLHGQLKNPRFDPKTDDGFTDLHITSVLKDDPARGGRAVLVSAPTARGRQYSARLPRLLHQREWFARPDLRPAGNGRDRRLPEGRREARRQDPTAKLAFFFKHLDSTDPTIAADAFFEFARASDADILKAAKQLDAAKVRKLIADPHTPPERLGVYSFRSA